jgi:glycosyltransferase involved in cell wall biosynthesis
MKRRTICLLVLSPVIRDARVLRHLKFLGEKYDLIAIGYGADPSQALPGVSLRWHGLTPSRGGKLVKIIRTLARWPGRIIPALDWIPCRMMAEWRAAREIIAGLDYDVFIGNDVSALLLAVWQQQHKGIPFIMDYHEFAPLEAEEKVWHRLFHGPQMHRLLNRYGRQAAGNVTVNSIFARRFEEDYGFKAITVRNAPELQPLPFPAARADGRIHLVFHGHAGGSRNLDQLLRAMALTDDRFVLHLMLTSGGEPDSIYRKLASSTPNGRVIFEDTVAPADIVQRLAGWDIGFNILEPLNYNHRHALPNKFFDYIHAGLATVCSNTVTGRQFVEQYGIGWVLESVTPHSIAALLNSLSPADIDVCRQASLHLREELNAQGEEGRLLELVGGVLGDAF